MTGYFHFRHFKTLALVLLPISISLLGCKGGGIADGADLSRAENSSSDLAPYIPKGPLTFGPSSVFQFGSITNPSGSQSDDFCRSVTTDKSGNIFCTGSTEGSLGETNGGSGDAFVAKWNSNGTLIWIKQLGAITKPGASSGREESFSIKLDSTGNIFIGGYTDSNFGETNGAEGADVFIAKMNSSGTLQWVKQLGAITKPVASAGQDVCYSIALDSFGNIYCGGTTNGSLGEANGNQIEPCTSNCNPDAFVAKWDKNGNLKWIKQIGHVTKPYLSRGSEECKSIAVDSKDNIYCGGNTSGSLGEYNGSGTVDGFGSEDMMLIKLSNQGDVVWIKQLGQISAPFRSNYAEVCESISLDRLDNIYCGGYTNGNLAEISGGQTDMVIAKWNSNGTLQWMKQLGAETKPYKSLSADRCTAITSDDAGSIYCSGSTHGPLEEINGGGEDAIITKWNSAGSLIWTKQLGNLSKNNKSFGDDTCHGLTIDSSNNLICAGSTTGPLGETNGGGYDAFIWIQPDGR